MKLQEVNEKKEKIKKMIEQEKKKKKELIMKIEQERT